MTDSKSAKQILGNNIKSNRMKRHWSQAKLAEEIGVNSASTVGNWEAGLATPDYDKLCFLADIFDVSVDMLLGRNTVDHTSSDIGPEEVNFSGSTNILVMYECCDEIGRAAIENCVQFHYDRCTSVPVPKTKLKSGVRREKMFISKSDDGYDEMCEQMISLKKLRKNSGKGFIDIANYLWARGYGDDICLGYIMGMFGIGPSRVPSQMLYDDIKAFLKGNYAIVPNVKNV